MTRTAVSKMKVVILIGLTLLATSASLFSQNIGWSLVNAKIRHEFPDVPRVKTSELAGWLSDGKRAQPVLLDVRTRAEFEVSHLANARRIEPGADAKTLSIPRDKAIVTYCSVGYRSAALAKSLRDNGYTRVFNLEGSIFRWANENRPLVREKDQPTAKVHPYNSVWAMMLLEKSHRATNAARAEPESSP